MALSSINIVLNAITDAFNRNIKKAADTMDASARRMGQSADAAGSAIENSLGSGQLRQKIRQVTDTIDEQKNITREFQTELEKLRQKRDSMSKMDIQGQKAVKREIEATKTALKDQSLAVSQLSATKQQYTQQLGVTNQTLGGTRAALNGLATSFSSVSSIIAIMSDDNKALRNTLLGINAALNMTAAIMMVVDLQRQFSVLSGILVGIRTFMMANPFMVGAIVIASIISLYNAFTQVNQEAPKIKDAVAAYGLLNQQIEKTNKLFDIQIRGLRARFNDETALNRELQKIANETKTRKEQEIKFNKEILYAEQDLYAAKQSEDADAIVRHKKRIEEFKKQQSENSLALLSLEADTFEVEKRITEIKAQEQEKRSAESKKRSEESKKAKEAEIMAELSIQKIMRSSIVYLEEYRYKIAKKAKEIRESFNPSSMVAGTTKAGNIPVLIQVAIDPKSYSQVVQDFNKLTEQIGAAISALGVDIAVGFGEAIGGALAGQKDAMANFGDAIIIALGGFMSTVGKLLITYAIGVEKFKTAFADWKAALAAGIALVAIGATIKTTMSKGPSVPAFANGGIVSGPTLGLMGEYPGARSNPEVIAPLDKLKTLMRSDQSSGYIASTTIQGRDLAIVLERYNKDSKRG